MNENRRTTFLLVLVFFCSLFVALIETICPEFTCGDGTCLSNNNICNGWKDCNDSSDETEDICLHRPCQEDVLASQISPGKFRCAYGACIYNWRVCDGIEECADGSDETVELCSKRKCDNKKFQCGYGACVSKSRVCDGSISCHDGTDETVESCAWRRRRCRTSRVKVNCLYGACLYTGAQCDGIQDCLDGSDEREEICGSKISTTNGSTPSSVTIMPKLEAGITTANSSIPSSGSVIISPTNEPPLCPPPLCQCTIEDLQFVCLPCDEIFNVTESCLGLQDNAGCSVRATDEAELDIISCGSDLFMHFATFERTGEFSCVQDGMVPPMTVVYADCWGVHQGSFRCHSDGLWREFGKKSTGNPSLDGAMATLCMPLHINSKLCGRKSRFQRNPLRLFDINSFFTTQNLWPFVMGLKRRQLFECTGTLITPYFVLTAAHCVSRSQELPNITMNTHELLVQWSDSVASDQYVEAIHMHPSYEGGQRKLNDIALVKLRKPMVLGRNMYPACVHFDEDPFTIPPPAVAFTRPDGLERWDYNFSSVLQETDVRCQNYGQRCPILEITDTQFCALPKNLGTQLRKGDSGGPLLQDKKDHFEERWGISGIVSIRVNVPSCQEPHTVFTKVASFKDWITAVVNNKYS